MEEDKNYNKIFPSRLYELMQEHNENQQKLANIIGKQRQTVSLYVTGSTNPDYETLKQIAEHYKVSADWLIGIPLARKEPNVDFMDACNMSPKMHKIKLSEEFADAVLNGDKTFEVRENDRGYQRGDLVKFTVVDKLNIAYSWHKLHDEMFVITYVLNGWGLEPNKVAFSIRKVSNVK